MKRGLWWVAYCLLGVAAVVLAFSSTPHASQYSMAGMLLMYAHSTRLIHRQSAVVRQWLSPPGADVIRTPQREENR